MKALTVTKKLNAGSCMFMATSLSHYEEVEVELEGRERPGGEGGEFLSVVIAIFLLAVEISS